MTEAARASLSALPKETHAVLDELASALERAAGPNLAALVVHGSAVRGDFEPARSDVDVVVVLHDSSLERLDEVAEPLLLARNAGRVEAMILRLDEIARSADVFPVFYADIAERHVVVAGSARPFDGLEIEKRHLRLRLEQELREHKIRMKRAAVDASGQPRALAGALERKLRQVRSPLRALLKLKGGSSGGPVGPLRDPSGIPEDRLEPVLRAAGAAYGVNVDALFHIRRDPGAAHAVFRKLLDAAVEDVDRMEDAA
ncbi:MAG: nucleotidyltransferase domain-containing protein [Acidobacteria bacterium]|nr:nucleotidyltransferase domain-containing protein [Acidobacteriota bacterium]